MRPIAAAHGCSVARVALAWQLTRSFVTSVIIGARTTEQLADNLAAAELELTDEEVQTIDAVSELPEEYPQWMIERQSQDRFGGQPR
jgi:aryl-alcohol dehydrogenase-like predicted oxidoreductase